MRASVGLTLSEKEAPSLPPPEGEVFELEFSDGMKTIRGSFDSSF